MSTSTQHPPIPRQPIGATFIVAISILGAFAVIQLLAAGAHYYGAIRQQIANMAAQQQRAADQASAPIALPPVSLPSQNRSAQPGLSSADTQKFQKLADKADLNFRLGDFDGSLKAAEDMEALLPGDPSMLLRKARALEQLGQTADAVAALKEVLDISSLPQNTRDQTAKKIDQLSQTLSNTPPSSIPRAVPALADPNGADLLDNGLQPGATLGIVEAQLSDGKEGTKHLKVAVKARKGATVSVQDVKIVVYFYETTDDGDPALTESKVVSQWLSPPIDWANDEPEILDMQYTVPNSDTAPGKKYYGYVIGVYYNKELQAFRSEPGKLSSDFPLPLYLKEDSN